MAGWEFRFGALCGGLLVRAFWQVAIWQVVPLGLTGVRYGGSLLVRVLGVSVGISDAVRELGGVVLR